MKQNINLIIKHKMVDLDVNITKLAEMCNMHRPDLSVLLSGKRKWTKLMAEKVISVFNDLKLEDFLE